MLPTRPVSFDNLYAYTTGEIYAYTTGEIETERKVLVVKRIRVTFHLAADENYCETIERVVDVYADGDPVVRSAKDSIEITSGLDLTTTDP